VEADYLCLIHLQLLFQLRYSGVTFRSIIAPSCARSRIALALIAKQLPTEIVAVVLQAAIFSFVVFELRHTSVLVSPPINLFVGSIPSV